MNEIVKAYFTAFSAKDITTLEQLYHDDVVLWEWGQRVFMGKAEVLEANTQLFNSSERLNLLVQSSASDGNKHFCELSIILDEKLISVLDVITLQDNKIITVQAYRGF
jgi:ketosteroid isomerase-like protein